MGTRGRLAALATAFIVSLTVGGCIGSPTPVPRPPAPGPAVPTPESTLAPTTKPPAPANGHPVGLRVLRLSRGADRPLVTLIFFPATASPPPTPTVAAAAATAPTAATTTGADTAGAAGPTTNPDPAPVAGPTSDTANDTGRAAGTGPGESTGPAMNAGSATDTGAATDTGRAAGTGPGENTGPATDNVPADTGVATDTGPTTAKDGPGGTADLPPELDLPTGFSVVGGWTWKPARGRFPLVLFSHGLSGSPQRYAAMLSGWAAAGFVVVAPIYPHTSEFTTSFRRRDIVNQPADARYVLNQVQRLNATPGDPLRGHLDIDRVAAVGHSAGGYTTMGLFTARHDPRLRAAVVMAGWLPPGVFAGPPATMLFLQGSADPVVPAAVSRAAYARVPWPKAYMLLRRNSHATYLRPGERGYALMESTVLNFLRWTLKRDQAAGRRLPRTHYPPEAE